MMVSGRAATGVFTDPAAVTIDRPQYSTSGRGPCVDAFRQQKVYRIADTSIDDRWPEFAAAAAAHGVRSTLSLPLAQGGEPLGALNLYSLRPNGFDQPTEPAETLALQAAIVLANAHAYHDARELNHNVEQALTSRRTIDYAIGIVLAAGGRTPQQAYQDLVQRSQHENRKLRDIAGEIVAATQTPSARDRGTTS